MQMLYTATEGILEHSLLSVHLSQLSKLQRFPKECRQLDTSFSFLSDVFQPDDRLGGTGEGPEGRRGKAALSPQLWGGVAHFR